MENSDPKNYPVLIFFPTVIENENGLLCGEVNEDHCLKTTNFFIYSMNDGSSTNKQYEIGEIGDNYCIRRRKYWVQLKYQNGIPCVTKLIKDCEELNPHQSKVIIYDKSRFMNSEFFKCKDVGFDDHFNRLGSSLKAMQSVNTQRHLPTIMNSILITLLSCFIVLDKLLCHVRCLLKFSCLFNHMSNYVKCTIWSLEYVLKTKCLTSLKFGNFFCTLIGDWFGGLFLIFWILSMTTIEDILQTLEVQAEFVVVALRDTVRYLMGSPADLKLHEPLNFVLGRFFLFHIDLWWAFLGFSKPLVELGLRLFICLGSLGLSFQLAILADLLALATFHTYVIYVYAAKLYNLQAISLGLLSKVFLGRKRNPLPGRVDSCPYTTEQLLIGTISFTVLLFLLPTTLVYYIVFTIMRLMSIGVAGLMTQACTVLQVLPLYSTVLWMFNSPITASCVRLTPKHLHQDQCVLSADTVQGSWWSTVKQGIPFPPAPTSIPWTDLCCHLVTGKLLYPV